MRDYCIVSPSFWIGETGRKIIAEGHECALIAMYLISSPAANAFGNYYLPVAHIAYAIGSPIEGASKALQRVCETGFCSYDHKSEVVWVHEMAKFQISSELKEGDNRVKWVNAEYSKLPKSPFLYDIYLKYKDAFHLNKPRGAEADHKGLPRGLEAPSKTLRSQEQEQDQEQDKRTNASDDSATRGQPPAPSVVSFKKVSKHFRQRLESIMAEVVKACEALQALPPIRGKTFNPYQAVQKAVNEGKHPDAILDSLRQMAREWGSGTVRIPWAWWSSKLVKLSQNAWEKESMEKAEGYRNAIAELARQKDLFTALGYTIKTIPQGRARAPG